MEVLVFLTVLVSVLAVFFLNGIYQEKKHWQGVKEKLRRQYGSTPDKNWAKEQYEGISKYHEAHKEERCIDDITWNDIGMDAVFKRLDYTLSKTGAEYLYHILRTPVTAPELLRKREVEIDYYREHEEERLSLQLAFARLGTVEKYSLYEYLEQLDNLEETGNAGHYICIALVFVTGALMLLQPGIGALLFLGVLCYNILSYLKEKGRMEPYLAGFGYIMRLLDNVERLQKEAGRKVRKQEEIVKMQGVSEKLAELSDILNNMRSFKRSASLALNQSGGAEPVGLFLDYIRMIFHLDLICFWKMRQAVMRHRKEIDRMLVLWGEMELVVNIGMVRASYETAGQSAEDGNGRGEERRQAAGWCIPQFTHEKYFHMEDGYYPLLPDAVRNSIETHGGILLTGSNASGKTTFLKTCAVNVLLAQTLHTCLAASMELCPGRLYSSMALRDDIITGESYYMVEIKALKRILDAAGQEAVTGNTMLYCFVDEVLRGTNTAERIAASTELLKSMAESGMLCFAATHDIELTALLQKDYENYHFEEEMGKEDVVFSYEIKKGPARTRNAIRLLRIMGYDAGIAERAEKRAAEFLSTGNWKI